MEQKSHSTEEAEMLAECQYVKLTQEQQSNLYKLKLNFLKDNHRYLKEHPEIKTLINILLYAVIKARPEDKSVQEFLAEFLQDNYDIVWKLLYKTEQMDGNQRVSRVHQDEIKKALKEKLSEISYRNREESLKEKTPFELSSPAAQKFELPKEDDFFVPLSYDILNELND
ncbi:unnamed protein product [Phyllotreta striolata]|uniref:Uncharacterized protein n=1 Tax=Phyllotreta striolata TaxID=444603 RepID=A0A9N9T9M1_PHYSR|nr:unnamed protein product [Phyllotreta striolata]